MNLAVSSNYTSNSSFLQLRTTSITTSGIYGYYACLFIPHHSQPLWQEWRSFSGVEKEQFNISWPEQHFQATAHFKIIGYGRDLETRQAIEKCSAYGNSLSITNGSVIQLDDLST
ncbi:hypothetical protein [Candidatus Neptunichlamydia sp. REUL1]|uniref:hypothetical protein n=1 Tax=Candidatus Neptunichlamydia sp. REUL1 TaxID=3064277 RepID=UPI002931112A|nr:hypothetical protein [Candidatus Neptunochlamydia sp. REUL1]